MSGFVKAFNCYYLKDYLLNKRNGKASKINLVRAARTARCKIFVILAEERRGGEAHDGAGADTRSEERGQGSNISANSELRNIYKFNANNAPAPWLFRSVQSVLNGARCERERGEQPR